MHPRNPYADNRPDFKSLAENHPTFRPFVEVGDDGYANIDWKDSDALRALTTALLKQDWSLEVDLPKDRLCPTIPNRLDYIYHLLDLEDYLPRNDRPLRILDIGTGAVAIYPLLIHRLRPNSIITATEKDLDSLKHAKTILESNGISSDSINLLVPNGESILFPLLDDEGCEVDMMMCNPPFFASLEEMQEGRDLKVEEAHTAHTGSDNEMVTDGGEVGFINHMIDESQIIGKRCSWYTSLVGRYSSLSKLVTKLQSTKITNYYILSIRPAKTVRWIIIWSFTHLRLPDSLTRPRPGPLDGPPVSFFKLLPPGNTVRHVMRPHRSISEIKSAVLGFLAQIRLYDTPNSSSVTDPTGDYDHDHNSSSSSFTLNLVARSNTWSRAARRKLAKLSATPTLPRESTTPEDKDKEGPILLKATLRIMDGSIEMDWTYGPDRADFDGLWKSIFANSGLVTRGPTGAASGSNSTSRGADMGGELKRGHHNPVQGEGDDEGETKKLRTGS